MKKTVPPRIRDYLSYLEEIQYSPQVTKKNFDTVAYATAFPCAYSQYVYVFDYTKNGIIFSKNTYNCLGFTAEEFDAARVISIIHPDDRQTVMHISQQAIEFLVRHPFPYKPFEASISLDYRVQKKDGSSIRILRQTAVTETDDLGRMMRTFGLCSDISSIKQGNDIHFYFTGPGSGKLTRLVREGLSRQSELSVRETEILRFIARGMTSAHIANALGISEDTIKTYRKRIFLKTACRNTAELIAYAFEKGIL